MVVSLLSLESPHHFRLTACRISKGECSFWQWYRGFLSFIGWRKLMNHCTKWAVKPKLIPSALFVCWLSPPLVVVNATHSQYVESPQEWCVIKISGEISRSRVLIVIGKYLHYEYGNTCMWLWHMWYETIYCTIVKCNGRVGGMRLLCYGGGSRPRDRYTIFDILLSFFLSLILSWKVKPKLNW